MSILKIAACGAAGIIAATFIGGWVGQHSTMPSATSIEVDPSRCPALHDVALGYASDRDIMDELTQQNKLEDEVASGEYSPQDARIYYSIVVEAYRRPDLDAFSIANIIEADCYLGKMPDAGDP